MKRGWIIGYAISMTLGYLAYYLFGGGDAPNFVRTNDQSYSNWDGSPDQAPLVTVGDVVLRREDVDVEHKLFHKVRKADPNMQNAMFMPLVVTQQPEASDTHTTSTPEDNLRVYILQSLIKRKILFQMLQRENFDTRSYDILLTCETAVQELEQDDWSVSQITSLRDRLCESYAIEMYMRERIGKDVQVSEQEIQDYYTEHRMDFFTPKKILIRHIHFVDEHTARKVVRKIKPNNFAWYAKNYSIAHEAKQGGLLSPFAAHEMPPFFTAVFRLKLGRVSSIVKSPYGYHMFLPLKTYPEKITPLSEVKDSIATTLKEQKQKELYQKWFQLALNTIPVKFAVHPEQLPKQLLYSPEMENAIHTVENTQELLHE